MRAAGPREGNRKHHPKAAPLAYRALRHARSSGVQPTPENGVRLRLWPPGGRLPTSRKANLRPTIAIGDSRHTIARPSSYCANEALTAHAGTRVALGARRADPAQPLGS